MNMRRRLPRRASARLLRAWREDRRGAALIQFIAVLPVFIFIIVGVWELFIILSGHQRLCEGTAEAARYLQVEAPYFEDGTVYPDDWIPMATDIINTELRSSALGRYQVLPGDVEIGPPGDRIAPADQSEVSEARLRNQWFYVKATGGITNPLAFLYSDLTSNQIRFACQSTAFYETEPLKSTDDRVIKPNCPPKMPECTPGPEPTECFPPNCPTPDPKACPCKKPN
jgi:hypothetical protein